EFRRVLFRSWLHGRSDRGHAAREEDGFTILAPDANEEYERDGRVLVYDDEDAFAEARAIVADTVDRAGCEVVAVHGFSNGAAFAGALACSGETFDGRLRGVIIDDPVPDVGTEDCALGDGVEIALYWTGGLTEAEPGASCAELTWTCRGTHLIGIEAYAENLGVDISE